MTVRPTEAAGLVLIRPTTTGGCEVLLGRRHRDARFMPDVYVFPGGRTNEDDGQSSGFPELLAPPPPGLDQTTRQRLAILARGALRETYEETGLLLGVPAAPRTDQPSSPPPGQPSGGTDIWLAFARANMAPAFGALRLVARAVTPAGSPIRFDTRFFLADGALACGAIGGDGELEDIRWVTVEATPSLAMPRISRLVLEEALAHLAEGPGGKRPAAQFSRV